jgi:hypothetical protein
MKVTGGGSSCIPYLANQVSPLDLLTALHQYLVQMGIKRMITVTVIDFYGVAIITQLTG